MVNFSTNTRYYAANVHPPKSTFLKNHILASRVCCAPKFLHVLENDQVLLANPPPGTGAFYNFYQRGIKNWLKI